MTDPTHHGRWAATANMSLALNTLHEAMEAGPGLPRIALFFGPSGYGKTVASAHAAAVTDAAYVQAREVWTAKSLLMAIAHELGIKHVRKTSYEIVDQIIEQLDRTQQPLILDESDYLVKKQFVDIIRDIHDATNVPIMMIGEEALPGRLKEWERFDNRILVATMAQPSTLADGRLLRNIYCQRVRIEDDLVDHFTTRCKGITRRIVANLNMAQRIAVDELSMMSIDRAAWADRPVMTGDVPVRRV